MSSRAAAVHARTVARQALRLRAHTVLDTVLGALTVYALAVVVTVAAPVASERVIVGAVLLVSGTVAATDVPRQLAREARDGTLAHLFLTPFGVERVVLVRALASLVAALASGAVVLALLLATVGTGVTLAPGGVVAGVLALGSALGIGLALSGVALIHAEVGGRFVPLVILVLVVTPVESVRGAALVPVAFGSYLVRLSAVEGAAVPPDALLVAAVVTVGHLLVGVGVLRIAARRARRTGRLARR